MTFLLIRFAVIAAVIAVLVVVLFAVAVRLKRRGRWDDARRRIAPLARNAADLYAGRTAGRARRTDARGTWKASARYAADRLDDRQYDHPRDDHRYDRPRDDRRYDRPRDDRRYDRPRNDR